MGVIICLCCSSWKSCVAEWTLSVLICRRGSDQVKANCCTSGCVSFWAIFISNSVNGYSLARSLPLESWLTRERLTLVCACCIFARDRNFSLTNSSRTESRPMLVRIFMRNSKLSIPSFPGQEERRCFNWDTFWIEVSPLAISLVPSQLQYCHHLYMD